MADVVNSLLNAVLVVFSVLGSFYIAVQVTKTLYLQGHDLGLAILQAKFFVGLMFSGTGLMCVALGNWGKAGTTTSLVIGAFWLAAALHHWWRRSGRKKLNKLLAKVKEGAGRLVVVPLPVN